MTAKHLISAQGLNVSVSGNLLLRNLDIQVAAGEVVALIGPNGAGKTTLLKTLAGIRSADSGEILFAAQPMAEMPRREQAKFVSYLGQAAELNWPMSVQDTVALGRHPHQRALSGASDQDLLAIERAMRDTDTLHLKDRTVDTLSGGEQMRVFIGRMLAVGANVLLADEPISGLDPYHQLEFMDLFVAQAKTGAGVVLVLHDLTLVMRYCHRVLLLDGGSVIADGAPTEVLIEKHLAEVYGVDAYVGEHAGQAFVLPWQRRMRS